MVPDKSTISAGRVVGGKYRLEALLSSGGMGSLWVAVHESLDVHVAVKFMITRPSDRVGRARFEREAKASALVRSPHVVQVLDYGTAGDVPFLVMELLEGEDLATRLERVGRLPVVAVATIAIQVCKALRVAHEASIVHRDLKPANVFLCNAKDEDVVKLLDFGLAKSLGRPLVDDLTTADTVLGSPRYMSPEHLRGAREVDHRSDLWSMGVILFRALTGTVPFTGTMVGDLIVKICTDPIPIVSQVAPDLGADFDPFFARAFARDPTERFQSARELSDAFCAIALRHGWTPGESLRPDPLARPSIVELPGWDLVSETSASGFAGPATPPARPSVVPAPSLPPAGLPPPVNWRRAVAIAVGMAALVVGALVFATQPTRPSEASVAPAVTAAVSLPSAAAPPASVDPAPAIPPEARPAPAVAASADPAPSPRPPVPAPALGGRPPKHDPAAIPAPAPAPAPSPAPAPDRTSRVLGF